MLFPFKGFRAFT